MAKRGLAIAGGIYLGTSVSLAAWLMPAGHEQPPFTFAPAKPRAVWNAGPSSHATRTLALAQARVRLEAGAAPATFTANPPDPSGRLSEPMVRCRYHDGPARGTTAKFDCVLEDGEVVKVKYGATGEIQAEVAASRLLTALGFGADRMYLVPRVRCYGCVRTPFYTNWILDYLHARELVAGAVPDDRFTDFQWVAVERRLDGFEIETGHESGWGWFELDAIDPSRGANRAERDALRLLALLLAHWDNKASNQRLVCLAPDAAAGGACPRPFAFIQDLGATFGPNKLDLDRWKAAPIWADAARCTVSMRQFPYNGGTFPDTQISEAGRQLIARELAAVSEPQAAALFSAARFREFHGGRGADADVNVWARALMDKVRQIAAAGPCPS